MDLWRNNGGISQRPILATLFMPAILVAMVLLNLGGAAINAATVVFRCESSAGDPSFADTPCQGAPSEELHIEHQSVFNAPTDPRETQRLADIEKRLTRARSTRKNEQQRAARRFRLAAQRAATACDAATKDLNQLKQRKRTGYSVRDAIAIQRREEELVEAMKAYCDG